MPVDSPRNEYHQFKVGDLVRRYRMESYVDMFSHLEHGVGIVIKADYSSRGMIEIYWRDTKDVTWFSPHMADEVLTLLEKGKSWREHK